jgi:general nucleoside transport system permease protein
VVRSERLGTIIADSILTSILAGTLIAGTPLILAALGELVTERSGVLNLGTEGMMSIGAVAGFVAAHHTGSATLGALAGVAAGTAMALILAVLALTLLANQVASGLALSIFGVGLSAFAGKPYESATLSVVPPLRIPYLADIPVLGRALFDQQALVYLAWALFAAIAWFLYRSRYGLALRAVGESPEAAHAIGYPVIRIRYVATLFGGAMSGLAGAFLSVFYTPVWVDGMVAGRGWIALALVVFATWRPARVLVGAYLFGGVMIAQLFVQGSGARLDVPSQFLSSLPYLATIVVLVLISRDPNAIRLNSPASLGRPYRPET